MNVKTSIITLWSYLTEAFDIDNIAAAFEETIDGFEFSVDKFSAEAIAELSEDNAKALLFDMGYMAVNGLFGGDWDTWLDVLQFGLKFDSEIIALLSF